jgi:DsbC/DsbD-like thiol-disulfide interchange protein
MKRISVVVSALSLSFLATFAHAASSDWVSSGETRMRLIVAEPASGEAIIRAAIQVDLAPGWKTYWRDPGEAGVPLQLDLSGSKNAALKEIHYPAPHRFDDGVTIWAGYKEPVVFPLEIERTDAALPTELSANIFIGICEKICVPFSTTLTVTVDNATSSTADQMAVQQAFAKLPMPASDQFGVASITANGNLVEITATIAEGGTSPELYLAAPSGWQFGVPQFKSAQGSKVHFEAPILFAPKSAPQAPVSIDYTLVTKGSAVSGVSELAR